jgi:Spy/CpxP family protein refolding chaperone
MTDPVVAPPRGTSTKVVATIVVVVAFVGGLVIGAIGDRLWTLHRGPASHRLAMHAITARVLSRLDSELSLTPQQHEQVKKILDAHAARMQTIWEGVRPQIHREVDQNNAEIEQVLTPEQRQKFAKLKMQFLPRHIRHF